MLSKSENDYGSKTYYVGNPSLQLLPESEISTTVNQLSCPLTFSYYLKSSSENWVLQTLRATPFTAFDPFTGKITV